jgi:hypothetical protein
MPTKVRPKRRPAIIIRPSRHRIVFGAPQRSSTAWRLASGSALNIAR